MTWVPIFEIASKDFDEDIFHLKKIFRSYEKKIHFENGFKFSPEAQFAMGWWFYTIYVKIRFIKKLVEFYHIADPNIKDENGILKMLKAQLKICSTAKVKFHGDKPIFAGYWSWMMK